jgi:hypothetical protein
MIRFFRSSGAGPALLLTLVAFGLWSEYFLAPPGLSQALDRNAMPLWDLVTGALEDSPLLAVIVSFTLMMTTAILMVRFNTSIFFIPRRTFLPSLIFIILYSVFPGEMVLNPALPASLLILAALWRMISSYRINGLSFNFFDAALMISSAGLIYAGSVWLIAIVLIAALILRSPDARELILAIAGAVLPWLIMYAIWYLTGRDPGELTMIIRRNLFEQAPSVYWSRTLLMLMIITGLNLLPSIAFLAREMPTCKIRTRKTWEIFIWVIIAGAVIYLFVPAVSAELIAIVALPVSFIIANYFAFTRRVVAAEVLFWSLMVMLVVSRLWPY